MATVEHVTNYIIARVVEDNHDLSLLKLQKLLYYVQAWYLVYNDGNPLFDNDFQAWVHGPVCREVYDRFNIKYRLYDSLSSEEIGDNLDVSGLSADELSFIDSVLDVYARYSGTQLEQLTHRELPWREARGNISPAARCENIISRSVMKDFYAKRLK